MARSRDLYPVGSPVHGWSVLVYLNGRLVEQNEARVSVFDRGFLYGDGLFDTLRVRHGRLFRPKAHARRLREGAQALGIHCPLQLDELVAQSTALVEANNLRDGWVRIQLTRGAGPRGYSPQQAATPTLVMTAHPAETNATAGSHGLRLILSTRRVMAGDPLSRIKTLNKLPQVLARAEADAKGADDAVLLNTNGLLAEATGSNLFWITGSRIHTPPLDCGVLPGTTRSVVFELCRTLGLTIDETRAEPDVLRGCDGAFVTSVGHGIAPIASFEGHPVPTHDWVARLQAAYWALVEKECAA